MNVIDASVVEEVCYKLLCRASIELPPEVEKALHRAYQRESNETAKLYFQAMLENIAIARDQKVPLCQDTGIPMYYINLGSEVHIKGSLRESINRATSRATRDVPLRQQVSNPLTREISKTMLDGVFPQYFWNTRMARNVLRSPRFPRVAVLRLSGSAYTPFPALTESKQS